MGKVSQEAMKMVVNVENITQEDLRRIIDSESSYLIGTGLKQDSVDMFKERMYGKYGLSRQTQQVQENPIISQLRNNGASEKEIAIVKKEMGL